MHKRTCTSLLVRPNPPVDVSAETTRGSQANLTVLWTAPSTGYGPTSYSISVEGGSVAPVVIQATAALQYSYRFSGLRNDRLYTVSVVAINCGGMSDPVRLIPANCKSIRQHGVIYLVRVHLMRAIPNVPCLGRQKFP